MNKIWKTLCMLLTGIGLLFTCACKTSVKLKLKFMVDNNVYAVVETTGKEVITMPKDPLKENYTFEGWYWDKDIWKNEFTANSLLNTPLSSNMEIYAHFVDNSYLVGTDIRIKNAEKISVDGVGDVFYLVQRNNQLICKLEDYVECNPKTTWTLSSDLSGNNVIVNKTIQLSQGDNPLYYIYVTDKNQKHDMYIILIHRNYLYDVIFNTNGGSSCDSKKVEEGYKLQNIPTSSKTGYTFDGWDYDFDNPITANIIVNAIWTANQYTIRFNTNGGDPLSSNQLRVTYDESYVLPTPTRTGYSFAGWYDNATRIYDGKWTYARNMDLTAHWEIINYDISYELNGGSSSQISLQTTYTVEDEIIIQSPTRTGYSFAGWSTSEEGSGIINYKINRGTTGNLCFYAKWQANTYTITYDVNGGDPLDSSTQDVTFDESYSLAAPTRLGYSFDGWYNNNTKINNGVWSTDGNMSLLAHWTLETYDIVYHLDGGIAPVQYPNNYTVNDLGSNNKDLIILNNPPVKPGYSFDGFFDDANYEKTYTPLEEQTWVGNKDVYFKWSPNKYTVNFDVNGGDPLGYDSMDIYFDTSYSLPVPTRSGYAFQGWYNNSELVTDGTWTRLDDLSLIAYWAIETYQINYELNGGTNSSNNPIAYNYEGETIVLADPTRTGYTFLGWTSTAITEPTKNYTIPHNSTGNITVTANWQANVYTITLNPNGGNGLIDPSIEVEFDSYLQLPELSKTGYTFVGWYNNTTKYESGLWIIPSDIELTAQWTIINYNINYELNGGTNNVNNPSSYTYDSDDIVLEDPTRTGYTFLGWTSTAITEPTKNVVISNRSLGEKTFTANWNANTYSIFLDVNGGDNLDVENLDITYDSNYELPIPERNEYTFISWCYNGTEIDQEGIWKLVGNITLRAKWAYGFFEDDINYCYFGKYPQTRVVDSSIISELDNLSEINENGYYEYNGEEYCKKTAEIAYVYHGSYWSYKDVYFDDGTKVTNNATYWFKVEPIKWKMVERDFDSYSFVSDKILVTHKLRNGSGYYTNYGGIKFTDSLASDYLNGEFLDTVFTTEEKNKMLDVVESKKVNVLQYQQVQEIWSTKNERKAYSTDYCKVTGCYYSSTYWLDDDENQYYSSNRINYYINDDGNISYGYTFSEKYENKGLRPLIRII